MVVSDVLLNGRDPGRELCLTPALWQVARSCDGRSAPAAIAGKVRSRMPSTLVLQVVRATIDALDEHGLLDNQRYRDRVEEHRARVHREPVRRTAPGLFPDDAVELRAALEQCMHSRLGPYARAGAAPAGRRTGLVGAVCPHASLEASGPCAAHVYAALAASPLPDVVVIVGYNHAYSRNTVETLLKDTISPMGRLKVARDFGEAMCSHAGDALSQDGLAAYHEHSIDMQVPWLQDVAEERASDILYVPIVLSSVPARTDPQGALAFRSRVRRVARAVREAARDLGQVACVLASGDFAHAGPYYGGPPVTDQGVTDLAGFDQQAIGLIVRGQADAFYRMTVGTTYCCPGPVYFLSKAVDWREAALLQYYTTWDVGMRGPNINSFAALSFS